MDVDNNAPDNTDVQDWRKGLPDEIRTSDKLKDFNDVGQLAKAYVDINVPDVPAKPEDYGIKSDNAAYADFSIKAHELKLTSDQAKGFHDYILGIEAKALEDYKAKVRESMDGSVKELRESWKTDDAGITAKISAISSKARALAGDDFINAIKESGAAYHSRFILGLEKLLSAFADDSFIKGDNQREKSAKEERDEFLSAIYGD